MLNRLHHLIQLHIELTLRDDITAYDNYMITDSVWRQEENNRDRNTTIVKLKSTNLLNNDTFSIVVLTYDSSNTITVYDSIGPNPKSNVMKYHMANDGSISKIIEHIKRNLTARPWKYRDAVKIQNKSENL